MDISKTVLPHRETWQQNRTSPLCQRSLKENKISEEHVWEEVVKAGESLPPDAPD